MNKNEKTKFDCRLKKPVTITITEYQLEVVRRLCTKFGEPGTPTATMIATCFARGLATLTTEIEIVMPLPVLH